MSTYSKVCKLVVLGDSSVGKTSIIHHYITNEFKANYKATIGADFTSKCVNIDGDMVEFQIWDTAGEERFHSVSSTFYRGTDACLLVFDLTNKDSFMKLSMWRNTMLEKGGMSDPEDFLFIILGNKSDLKDERCIKYEDADQYAKSLGCNYYEVSAKTGENISTGFEEIGKKFQYKTSSAMTIKLSQVDSPVESRKTDTCC